MQLIASAFIKPVRSGARGAFTWRLLVAKSRQISVGPASCDSYPANYLAAASKKFLLASCNCVPIFMDIGAPHRVFTNFFNTGLIMFKKICF